MASGTGRPDDTDAIHHEKYYIPEGNVTFLVENHIYRVHRFFFERESITFTRLLRSPTKPGEPTKGSSDENSIKLKDIRSADFALFLWVFYNPKYSIYEASEDEWAAILHLAHIWSFPGVKELAIRELEKKDIDPIKKISLYQDNEVEKALLLPSFVAVCARDEPLSIKEGLKLGLKTALTLAAARERTRVSPSTTQLSSALHPDLGEEDLQSLVRDTFHSYSTTLESGTRGRESTSALPSKPQNEADNKQNADGSPPVQSKPTPEKPKLKLSMSPTPKASDTTSRKEDEAVAPPVAMEVAVEDPASTTDESQISVSDISDSTLHVESTELTSGKDVSGESEDDGIDEELGTPQQPTLLGGAEQALTVPATSSTPLNTNDHDDSNDHINEANETTTSDASTNGTPPVKPSSDTPTTLPAGGEGSTLAAKTEVSPTASKALDQAGVSNVNNEANDQTITTNGSARDDFTTDGAQTINPSTDTLMQEVIADKSGMGADPGSTTIAENLAAAKKTNGSQGTGNPDDADANEKTAAGDSVDDAVKTPQKVNSSTANTRQDQPTATQTPKLVGGEPAPPSNHVAPELTVTANASDAAPIIPKINTGDEEVGNGEPVIEAEKLIPSEPSSVPGAENQSNTASQGPLTSNTPLPEDATQNTSGDVEHNPATSATDVDDTESVQQLEIKERQEKPQNGGQISAEEKTDKSPGSPDSNGTQNPTAAAQTPTDAVAIPTNDDQQTTGLLGEPNLDAPDPGAVSDKNKPPVTGTDPTSEAQKLEANLHKPDPAVGSDAKLSLVTGAHANPGPEKPDVEANEDSKANLTLNPPEGEGDADENNDNEDTPATPSTPSGDTSGVRGKKRKGNKGRRGGKKG